MTTKETLLPIEEQYLDLCTQVMRKGHVKELFNSGDGQYIKTILGAMLRHDFDYGFPVYSSKKVMWKTSVKEMLWFIQGTNDPAWLIQNKVKIWDDWIYKAHQKQFPDSTMSKKRFQQTVESIGLLSSQIACPDRVPLHYGNLTNWEGTGHDQTEWVLEQLPKAPHRKSYLVSLWNPLTVYHQADATGNESVVLPACHFAHQLVSNSTGHLSLIVDIRSNDLFLGNPFNVAQYGALLEMYCHCLVNRTGTEWFPDELVVMIHDAHLYSKHFGAVQTQQIQSLNVNHERATLLIENRGQTRLQDFVIEDFQLSNYNPQPYIKGDLFDAGGY